ncbi:hypothetical protein MMMDOFMJ_0181 [Methylobacterium gnaphalii]|nr:hypothetical protein MMMDOFMJ_0181 [Methylobacterium gnaphalii]
MPGTAKIEDGRGLATIKLSKAAGVADTVQKIGEGVIRNVSVGYWIHKVEKTEADDGTVARWDVVDWEPLEISAVPVPADAASQIRSEQGDGAGEGPVTRSCLIVTRNPAKRPPTTANEGSSMANRTPKTAPKGKRTAKTTAEIEAEKKRLAEARAAARAAKRAGEDESDEDEDERDEEQDEERDGDDADNDESTSDDERDGDDDSEDDVERDSDEDEDDDEAERSAPAPSKRKNLTAAEVREAAQEAVRADRARCSEIRSIAAKFGLPKFGERHAAQDTSVRAFKELVLEKLAARQAQRGTTTFAAASTAGVGENYRAATPNARDYDKGAAEARALLGKK